MQFYILWLYVEKKSFHKAFTTFFVEKSTFKFSQNFSLRDLLDQQWTNYFKKIHGFVGKLSLQKLTQI